MYENKVNMPYKGFITTGIHYLLNKNTLRVLPSANLRELNSPSNFIRYFWFYLDIIHTIRAVINIIKLTRFIRYIWKRKISKSLSWQSERGRLWHIWHCKQVDWIWRVYRIEAVCEGGRGLEWRGVYTGGECWLSSLKRHDFSNHRLEESVSVLWLVFVDSLDSMQLNTA